MIVEFLTIGCAKEPWLDEFISKYSKKISLFCQFKVTSLKSVSAARDQADFKKQKESETLLNYFKPDDLVLLFDEDGKTLDSEGFAKALSRFTTSGKKRCILLIGGPFGVTNAVKERADVQVSLSKMTFSHQVAIVSSLEQIYRGFCIMKGIPYHNV